MIAAHALVCGCDSSSSDLLERATSTDEGDRYRAVIELEEAGDRAQAVAALRSRIADSSARVRLAAARSLSARAGEAAMVDLADLLDDPAVEVRRTAVEELIQIGGSAAIDELIGALGDTDPGIRSLLRQGLIELGVSGQEQIRRSATARRRALIEQLENARWSIRIDAVRGLAECGDEVAIAALSRSLRDPDPQVAAAAAKGIGSAAATAGWDGIGEALSGVATRQKAVLLRGLVEAPPLTWDEDGAEALCPLLGDDQLGRAAARAVGRHQGRCDLDQMMSDLGERRPLEAAARVVLASPEPQRCDQPMLASASNELWRSGSTDELLLAASSVCDRDLARGRIQTLISAYQSESSRWGPLPEAALDPDDGDAPDVGDDPPPEPPGSLLAGKQGSEALADLLSLFPPRPRAWVEFFPPGGDPSATSTSLLVAGEIGIELDEDTLDELINGSPDPEVRVAAAFASADPDLLAHKSAVIRATVAEALGRRAGRLDGATKARLAFMMADSRPRVRRAAARSLGASGDPAALRPLLAAFQRWPDEATARALGALGQHDAARALAAALEGSGDRFDVGTITAILGALGQVGGPDQRELVESYLSHPEAAIRAAAVRAAWSLGGSRLGALVAERRSDFALTVRQAAFSPE